MKRETSNAANPQWRLRKVSGRRDGTRPPSYIRRRALEAPGNMTVTYLGVGGPSLNGRGSADDLSDRAQ